jgi:hypothetical protein
MRLFAAQCPLCEALVQARGKVELLVDRPRRQRFLAWLIESKGGSEIEGDVYDLKKRIITYSDTALHDLEQALVFNMDEEFAFEGFERMDAVGWTYDFSTLDVSNWLQMTSAWLKLRAVGEELT